MFYVSFTFADVLLNLCMVYDDLRLKCENVPAGIVAEAHNGNQRYGTASLKQTAQRAMILSALVNETIRDNAI